MILWRHYNGGITRIRGFQACHAKYIVVFAQLYVDGVNEGIHGVLVRCRDDNLGVSIAHFCL